MYEKMTGLIFTKSLKTFYATGPRYSDYIMQCDLFEEMTEILLTK